MKMGDRDDEYLFSPDPINQSIGESLQGIPPVFTFIDWPKQWKLLNPSQSLLYFVKKIASETYQSYLIIGGRVFNLLVGIVMKLYFVHG
jgi:hypothetical protein